MTTEISPATTVTPTGAALGPPSRVRYGVLMLACSLSMITYLDRVCFGSVAGYIRNEFNLSDFDRGLLFGAFTLAYSLFEIPSGWLGDVFGPRKTLLRIVIWWSIFTALTGLIWPIDGWLVFGFWTLVVVRFCFGMGEAGAYPNIARAFHSWFPIEERGFAKGTVWMAGRFMGGATPLIVNALIFTVVAADGSKTVYWRHTFWIFGILGVVWCTIFWWWFRDRPESHPGVNAAELSNIQRGKVIGQSSTAARVPWGRILGSGNLWLLCLAYFCSSYGWYFNITYLPDYLEKFYGLSKVNEPVRAGLLTGAPLLCGAVACLLGGLLTDFFVRRTGNRKWGRRLFGMMGKGVCGACYFSSMFAPDVYWFVFFIAMASFWNDMAMGAAWASCLDIGRKYSGIVSGCMNTVGNFGGFMANIITGAVLSAFIPKTMVGGINGVAGGAMAELAENQLAITAWHINFSIFTGVYVVAVFLWLFFDSTKPLVDED
jgi:MFS transporter, ACS family, glucarate transporter